MNADGSSAKYSNWNPGEPNNVRNEDCTELLANGKWNDLPCTGYSRYLVCDSSRSLQTFLVWGLELHIAFVNPECFSSV